MKKNPYQFEQLTTVYICNIYSGTSSILRMLIQALGLCKYVFQKF